MGGKIVNVDKDLELGTKATEQFESKYNASFNGGKYLSCRDLSSGINDLTIGNNEAIATILIYTRMIGQQARSYDIGINILAHGFASFCADTCDI